MRSPVPPLISRISSDRPPFCLNLNPGTFFRGAKNASAPSTGSALQCTKSVPWLSVPNVR